jgi:hypothetical protein
MHERTRQSIQERAARPRERTRARARARGAARTEWNQQSEKRSFLYLSGLLQRLNFWSDMLA